MSDAENQNVWDISKIEKKNKVWIASYSDTIYPKQEKPVYGGKCHAWQYTNKGTVNGIDDKVDMVVCYFTKEKEEPKDSSVKIAEAAAPLTAEDKIYTAVEESAKAEADIVDGKRFTPVSDEVTAKSETNLRTAPSTDSSDVVYTLKNGEYVKRVGVHGNGWSKLEYNGQTVYAISSYLVQ